MVKKTGLGKGLDALFSMPVAEEEQQKAGDELKNLKLIDIEPNRNQARKIFEKKCEIIREYQESELTLQEISSKHGIASSSLVGW